MDVEHTCVLLDASYWKMDAGRAAGINQEWKTFSQGKGFREIPMDQAVFDLWNELIDFFKKKTIIDSRTDRSLWTGPLTPIKYIVKTFANPDLRYW